VWKRGDGSDLRKFVKRKVLEVRLYPKTLTGKAIAMTVARPAPERIASIVMMNRNIATMAASMGICGIESVGRA
ncbi:MAG TPA: hypothetical protein VMU27_02250, partial [Candidatus Paceibacterota bacterium]|nr:hypothetical protein [Candidatus Paceibacterota bacterium]